MHYVIGDIHGCYQDMIALLNKIESQDQDAQIIFVGDFIDRGPDVDKVLDWSLENITLDGKYEEITSRWYLNGIKSLWTGMTMPVIIPPENQCLKPIMIFQGGWTRWENFHRQD